MMVAAGDPADRDDTRGVEELTRLGDLLTHMRNLVREILAERRRDRAGEP